MNAPFSARPSPGGVSSTLFLVVTADDDLATFLNRTLDRVEGWLAMRARASATAAPLLRTFVFAVVIIDARIAFPIDRAALTDLWWVPSRGYPRIVEIVDAISHRAASEPAWYEPGRLLRLAMPVRTIELIETLRLALSS